MKNEMPKRILSGLDDKYYPEKSSNKCNPVGFTLIELLIIVTMMALLFGLGLANYRDFARRKNLERAAIQVRNELKLAKEYALSGKKPSPPCQSPNYFDGYVFVNAGLISGIQNFRIEADCNVGANIVVKPNTPLNVGGVTFSIGVLSNCTGVPDGITSVTFQILGKGIIAPSGSCVQITFIQANTPNTYIITVDSSGTIK